MRGIKNNEAAVFAALSVVGALGMAGLVATPTHALVNCPDGSTAETIEACGPTEETPGDELQTGPTAGEGVNYAPLPNTDEELAAMPAFQEAVAPITNLDKTQALKAALKSVDQQIPDWQLWDETIYGMMHAKGITFDPRMGFGGDLGAYRLINSIAAAIYGDEATAEQIQQIEDAIKQLAPEGTVTMEKAVAYAKTLPQYSSDPKFKEMVDDLDAYVQAGAAVLRKNLPLLNPTLTEDALKDKTADELVALTEALPKFPAYYQLWSEYNTASVYSSDSFVASFSESEEDRETLARMQTVEYGRLVLAAKQILPSFAVDLSGVPQLPQQVPAELPKASAPAVPDTGLLGGEDGSANIVTVALLGVAAVVGGAGLVLTAKRYLFSPLKRRKH